MNEDKMQIILAVFWLISYS